MGILDGKKLRKQIINKNCPELVKDRNPQIKELQLIQSKEYEIKPPLRHYNETQKYSGNIKSKVIKKEQFRLATNFTIITTKTKNQWNNIFNSQRK